MKKGESEALLLANRRLAAVGSVASMASHMGKNRLATLRGALELLAEGMENHLSAEYRAALLREFDRFIGDFALAADMMRSDLRRPEKFSAHEAAVEIVAAFGPWAEEAGAVCVLDGDGLTEQIEGDRRLFRVALLQLLRNAADAVRGRPNARITVRIGGEGSRVYVEVEDTGPGVPSHAHDTILLEPPPGPGTAGLGLTLCHDCMAVVGGAVEYLTPKGRAGARFRLTFPRAEQISSSL